MRSSSVVVVAMVLGAVTFSSCTCHKEVEQSAGFPAPPSGFHASGEKSPPTAHARAHTPAAAPQTPPAEVAAASSSPSPVAIPDDFPKDVPIFKGAAVTQVQPLANNAHNVLFTTSAPVADVRNFYEQQMTGGGWKVTQQFARPDHAFMSFQKGNMVANLQIAQDPAHPGQQIIGIMYEEQKPLDFDEF